MQESKTLFKRFFSVLAVLVLLAGCGGGHGDVDTTAIKAYGVANEPIVKEFNDLFADASHKLLVSSDDDSKATWTSDAVIHNNRFRLYMEFDADLDVDADTLTRSGDPTFYLVQNPDPKGGTDTVGEVKTAEFGEAEWEKIVAANGNPASVLRLLK